MEESTEKIGKIICPGCGKLNADGTHFCPACGAPLSSHATTDPLGTVFAEGYAARRALSQPTKPIIVVGIWAWMLPISIVSVIGFIAMVSYFVEGVVTFQLGHVIIALIAGIICLVLLYISSTFLYRVTQKVKEASAVNPVHTTQDDEAETLACLTCGQAMAGNASQCQGCGWSYSRVSEAQRDDLKQ